MFQRLYPLRKNKRQVLRRQFGQFLFNHSNDCFVHHSISLRSEVQACVLVSKRLRIIDEFLFYLRRSTKPGIFLGNVLLLGLTHRLPIVSQELGFDQRFSPPVGGLPPSSLRRA